MSSRGLTPIPGENQKIDREFDQLDELQDQLVAESDEQEMEAQKMKVDNRSIFTIRDQIAKDDKS